MHSHLKLLHTAATVKCTPQLDTKLEARLIHSYQFNEAACGGERPTPASLIEQTLALSERRSMTFLCLVRTGGTSTCRELLCYYHIVKCYCTSGQYAKYDGTSSQAICSVDANNLAKQNEDGWTAIIGKHKKKDQEDMLTHIIKRHTLVHMIVIYQYI